MKYSSSKHFTIIRKPNVEKKKRVRPSKLVSIVRHSGICGHRVKNSTVIRTSKVYITTAYPFRLFSNHSEI